MLCFLNAVFSFYSLKNFLTGSKNNSVLWWYFSSVSKTSCISSPTIYSKFAINFFPYVYAMSAIYIHTYIHIHIHLKLHFSNFIDIKNTFNYMFNKNLFFLIKFSMSLFPLSCFPWVWWISVSQKNMRPCYPGFAYDGMYFCHLDKTCAGLGSKWLILSLSLTRVFRANFRKYT